MMVGLEMTVFVTVLSTPIAALAALRAILRHTTSLTELQFRACCHTAVQA